MNIGSSDCPPARRPSNRFGHPVRQSMRQQLCPESVDKPGVRAPIAGSRSALKTRSCGQLTPVLDLL